MFDTRIHIEITKSAYFIQALCHFSLKVLTVPWRYKLWTNLNCWSTNNHHLIGWENWNKTEFSSSWRVADEIPGVSGWVVLVNSYCSLLLFVLFTNCHALHWQLHRWSSTLGHQRFCSTLNQMILHHMIVGALSVNKLALTLIAHSGHIHPACRGDLRRWLLVSKSMGDGG